MLPVDRLIRSNLKLKHLQLLVALDQFRHLGRAAEYLSLTQPAVSKTLAEVERLFELELFLRGPRGTEPTPYGSAVVRFARSVLADFERTRDELSAVHSGAAGRVNVGAMVVALGPWLAPAVLRLKALSPHTTVSVEEGDLTRLLPRLRQAELDLIVGRLEPGYAAPDLETEALRPEPMCLVVGLGHPLATLPRVDWKDLNQWPWVLPPAWASSRQKLAQQFHKRGLHPPVDVIETASHLATFSFLQARSAIGFVAQQVAQQAVAQGQAAMLRIKLPIDLPPLGIILLRGRRRSPACEQMLACLREAVTPA